MKALIHAEITKLVTTRAAFGLLLGAIAISVLAVLAPGENAVAELSKPIHEQQWAFIVATLMRVFLLVLGIRAVTDEFRHGTMTPSLLVAPKRDRLVGAKVAALAVSGIVVAATAGAALVGTALSVAALNGVTLNLDAGNWPTFAGMVLSGALWPVVGIGLGLIVRSQVAAIVGGLVWLMAIEEILRGRLGDLAGYLPGQAGLGLAISSTGRILLSTALILAVYALVAAAAGAVIMSRRDVS
jgi:ABC-2 type transport system permease protein